MPRLCEEELQVLYCTLYLVVSIKASRRGSLMGDFGPAYAETTAFGGRPTSLFRCEDCGMQLPVAAGDAGCSICGGTLRRIGGNSSSRGGSTAPQRGDGSSTGMEEVQQQAEQILSAILPPDLLQELAGGGNPNKPADDDAVAALPLVKIEPYVSFHVLRGPPSGAALPHPNRDVLANAAERRANAAAVVGSQADASASAVPSATAAAPAALPARQTALEIRATGSAFGTPLADLGEGKPPCGSLRRVSNSRCPNISRSLPPPGGRCCTPTVAPVPWPLVVPCHLSGGVAAPLAIASPRDGARDLDNAAEVKGKLVLMWRGGCSFVEKVRRAQAAGAVGAVVVQTDMKKWPFTMSDTANVGGDVTLPSLMISPADGDAVCAAIEVGTTPPEGDGGGACARIDELWGEVRARDHHTSCAVCLQVCNTCCEPWHAIAVLVVPVVSSPCHKLTTMPIAVC